MRHDEPVPGRVKRLSVVGYFAFIEMVRQSASDLLSVVIGANSQASTPGKAGARPDRAAHPRKRGIPTRPQRCAPGCVVTSSRSPPSECGRTIHRPRAEFGQAEGSPALRAASQSRAPRTAASDRRACPSAADTPLGRNRRNVVRAERLVAALLFLSSDFDETFAVSNGLGPSRWPLSTAEPDRSRENDSFAFTGLALPPAAMSEFL